LSDPQWRFKSSPEEWSALECVEHLAIVEGFLLERIRTAATTVPDSSDVLAQCAGKENIIQQKVPLRGAKAKAPEMARPSGRFADTAELIDHFTAARDRTVEYARTTSDRIREHTFPHFVFGPLDGYQWLIFCAAHTERHTKQLLEAIAAAASKGQTGA